MEEPQPYGDNGGESGDAASAAYSENDDGVYHSNYNGYSGKVVEGCDAPLRIVPNMMGATAIRCAECLSALRGPFSCRDECAAVPQVRA